MDAAVAVAVAVVVVAVAVVMENAVAMESAVKAAIAVKVVVEAVVAVAVVTENAVVMENAVAMESAVVAVDAVEAVPELPFQLLRAVPTLREPSAVDSARDMVARPARRPTPSTEEMALARPTVAIARVAPPVVEGPTRPQRTTTRRARPPLPVRRSPRSQLLLLSPSLLRSLRRKSASLSMTTRPRKLPSPLASLVRKRRPASTRRSRRRSRIDLATRREFWLESVTSAAETLTPSDQTPTLTSSVSLVLVTTTSMDAAPVVDVAEADVIRLLVSHARAVARAVVARLSSTTMPSLPYEHVTPAHHAAPSKVNVKYLSHFQHALFRCE